MEKLRKILIAILIVFLVADILNATYVAIWQVYSYGMEPLYGTWLQSFIPDVLFIILLLIKQLQLIGLIFDSIANLCNLFFLYQTSSINPFAWLHVGRIQWGISIILQLIEMLICIICIFISLKVLKAKSNKSGFHTS